MVNILNQLFDLPRVKLDQPVPITEGTTPSLLITKPSLNVGQKFGMGTCYPKWLEHTRAKLHLRVFVRRKENYKWNAASVERESAKRRRSSRRPGSHPLLEARSRSYQLVNAIRRSRRRRAVVCRVKWYGYRDPGTGHRVTRRSCGMLNYGSDDNAAVFPYRH